MAKTGRNDPCPCGSGRKYKQCCEREEVARGPGASRVLLWVMAIVVGGGLLVAFDRVRKGSLSSPEPYEYNAERNQYWDPSPGHGHWHDGVPPGAAQPALDSGAPTPAPWFYNAATNQHWNPDHGHWHDGPAPLDRSIQDLTE